MEKNCPRCIEKNRKHVFKIKGDYENCFTCFTEDNNLKKCPVCKKLKKFDPEKWPSCYQCGAGANKIVDTNTEYDVPEDF